jgi:ribosomal-protein-alanine N-acetyltransferase
MNAPEYLQTERLVLRRPVQDDVEYIFMRYASDAEVTRYLSWHRHVTRAQTLEFLHFSDSLWSAWPAGPYLIESRGSGALLGSTGFSFLSPTEAETGYVLARDAWGKGYATEALTSLMPLSGSLGLQRVYATCHLENLASQRVLGKCGFVRQLASSLQSEFPNLNVQDPNEALCYEWLSSSLQSA